MLLLGVDELQSEETSRADDALCRVPHEPCERGRPWIAEIEQCEGFALELLTLK
jgi:hypothetical protein